ncbi:MAG TPA: hypothetical protein VJ990_09760, partial [Clostridia bacterium]|nr:hypothetical protein [Clostridia bacterium]
QMEAIEESLKHLNHIKNPDQDVLKKALSISVNALEYDSYNLSWEDSEIVIGQELSKENPDAEYLRSFIDSKHIQCDKAMLVDRYGSMRTKTYFLDDRLSV